MNRESDVPTKRGVFFTADGVVDGLPTRLDVATPEVFAGGVPYALEDIPELGIQGAFIDVEHGSLLRSKRMKLEEGAHISLLDVLDVWWFYGEDTAKALFHELSRDTLHELLRSYESILKYVPEENRWALDELRTACEEEIRGGR